MTLFERDFINVSVKQLFKEQSRRRRITQALISSLVAAPILLRFAFWQWQQASLSLQRFHAENEEVLAQSVTTENLLTSAAELDALLYPLKAGKNLRKYGQAVNVNNSTKAIVDLESVVYGLTEHNRLSSHSDDVNSLVFSPDGKT
ncbi:hypothetical protein, partial [uncultured Nostoc sp.]|uniref:hypothetical protein n=1 Tax=uncultured Nostoc sp. TaxID=340711 RepID=UPI0035CB2B26